MIIHIQAGLNHKGNFFFRLRSKLRSMKYSGKFEGFNTPIIINNFNRLAYLEKQLEWLDSAGFKNIFIIDNASTYPPLRTFYEKTKHTVFQLDDNVGHESLWRSHIQMFFKNQYYVYTDPDVIPIESCPKDCLKHFYDLMIKYDDITKVGFGLKIDDIPDHYSRRDEVLDWEGKFWIVEKEKDVFKAPIDTTFALYAPNVSFQQWDTALRTGGDYQARHLPWYEDLSNPNEEDQYFKEITTKVSSWIKKEGTYQG